MVSFQTSADGHTGVSGRQPTQPPPPPPEPVQSHDDDAANPWAVTDPNQQSHNNSADGTMHRKPVPNTLQPGLGNAPRPPIPQMRYQDTGATLGSSAVAKTEDSSGNKSTDQISRVPSILRPGGKSPSLNPFRNKEGGSAASQVPTEAMSKMHLESASTNPWGSALSSHNTGVSTSEGSRTEQVSPPVMPPEFQQDPWAKHDAVELDATSYAHPPQPLSVPTPEEQSVWGGESQSMSKSQMDSQSTQVKPADEFSQIFDDQHAWDDLGRKPKMKRSGTNKTAGEDSDQDDWNMIDSETSSLAGDGADGTRAAKTEAKKPPMPSKGALPAGVTSAAETSSLAGDGADGTRAAKTEAKKSPMPSKGALPAGVTSAAAVSKINAPETLAAPRPSTPYVDAPATPLDDPQPDSNKRTKEDKKSEDESQTKEGATGKPPIDTVQESQSEPRIGAPLIEPIGYEPPPQSSPEQHPPQTSGLLPQLEEEPQQEEEPPALPPRETEPTQRWAATREPVDGQAEIYQIKKIRWHDPDSIKNPRVSPILVQNENGPCPLVALVNALSLTTPADASETTLVQVLCSRDRISLNFILDAVFDELMSPRRTSSEDALPDISELYEFLQSLHTGMNVNPRFIPTEQMVRAYKRSSLTHLHPTERDGLMPGTFENSLEMKLYATFSIPLIHGWLPARSDPVYDAFERQAASYEDAQNLLFRQEELEAKLSDPEDGLSGPELQLYQDVMAIKTFMSESATQLTPWGINVISRAIRPGTFAILFRNDHFSTLYCHPVTMELLTLVTDAGYSGHEEVVWETLEDVNGEMSVLYAGDFRPAGSPKPAGPSSGPSQSNDSGGEWSRVPNRRGKDREEEPYMDMPMSPGVDHEQEDRDLALALQLQEEEEQKEREEQERRRQESRLSEQFIEQQGRQPPQPVARDPRRRTSGSGPTSPGRASSSNVSVTVSNSGGGRRSSEVRPPPQPPRPQTQNVQSLIPPATTGLRPAGRPAVNRPAESGEEAPPSYEAAQHDRRYVPGQGNPPAGRNGGGAHGGGGMISAMPQLRPGVYTGNVAFQRPYGPPGVRMSQGPGRERDRDCVVM